jgi:hypothetical protein
MVLIEALKSNENYKDLNTQILCLLWKENRELSLHYKQY